ncbi:MAG TPA: hypothetical protein VFO34_00985 [Candidatus Acidoferrales bacterium]|nr:hypothetical protein [Candidatus Acidoferrales bacterium]
MSCGKYGESLAGYIDATLPEGMAHPDRVELTAHLDECSDCRQELERYRNLQQLMSRVPRVEAPENLATEIRVALGKAREEQAGPGFAQRMRDRADLIIDNVLRPVAIPAMGGLVAALMVFALVLPVYSRVAPLNSAPDEALPALFEPARLEVLANFPVTLGDSATDPLLLVQAEVGVDGSVIDYKILSGPTDASTRRQLDQLLMFSRFRPSRSFGRPVAGGRVVMSFSAVSVHG